MADAAQVAGARSLVQRARSGDQNAMGMLAMIRDSAEQGSKRAQVSLKLIKDFIGSNPVPITSNTTVSFGEEIVARKAVDVLAKRQDAPPFVALFFLTVGGDNAIMAGAIVLANGPPLTNARIKEIVSSISNPEIRKCVYMAIAMYNQVAGKELPKQAYPYVRAGECIGQARGLQAVRKPGARISKYDANAGWEVGE